MPLELLGCVHHYGPSPRDRLAQRPPRRAGSAPGAPARTETLSPSPNSTMVPSPHRRARRPRRSGRRPRTGRRTPCGRARGMRPAAFGSSVTSRYSGSTVMSAHRPGGVAHVPGDDAHGGPVGPQLRNLRGLDAPVARVAHLVRRGQVRPQLEAAHSAPRVAMRHLLMDDAAAGGHPLDVTGADGAVVAHRVTVIDSPSIM